MQLLEAHKADLARTWCRLQQKAELSLVALSDEHHICRHSHSLLRLNLPRVMIFVLCARV